jgi:tetratricopeptide (TPR) repeat protein
MGLSGRTPVLLLSVLVLTAIEPSAQTPTPSAAEAAADALQRGQFDEVERLLRDSTSARAAALRARAAAARGRYDEAQQLLTGPAASSPASDAALELGLLHVRLGRRAEGIGVLERLADAIEPRSAADYLRFSLALRALGEFKNAQTAIEEGIRLDAADPDLRVAYGELFYEKYDAAEAGTEFQAALELDDMHPAALVGFAKVALQQNPPDAQRAVERALETNASYEPAHLLMAEMALDERRRDEAHTSVDRALDINPRSLDALSLQAAMAFLEGRPDDLERTIAGVLAINPAFGEVYRVVGDHAARNYRFDEAVDLVRQGLEIDPGNTRAHADLGMHLLRTGDEPGARQALERSFSEDPYDIVTFNLLDLLDRLDDFEVVRDGNIVMKFSPEEAAIMREQALPLAREALDTLSTRWALQVDGPILIEMFPKHDDFAVRNLGLPGMIGALGACFGRVVTLDSPRARPPGEYNWQPTLWHELAHVVTLQLSNNRVPRWLTEGISVWEERRARPEWGREMVVAFARAIDEDKVLPLATLNEGFSDPRMIALAYHQASLVVEHLAEQYGEASLKTLLQAYGRGLETEPAFETAFKATVEDVQATFDAKLEREYGALRTALDAPKLDAAPSAEEIEALAAANPGSFPVQMTLGQTLAEAGDYPGAIGAFERAAALVPSATGADNPHKLIAALAMEQDDTERAVRALEAVLAVDHADIEAARTLVRLVEPAGDPARAQQAYQRLVNVDPYESASHSALGRLALERRDVSTAVRAFRSALATSPPDVVSAHADLAEAYLEAGSPDEAKTQVLMALELAPSFERAQDLLLRVVDGASTR